MLKHFRKFISTFIFRHRILRKIFIWFGVKYGQFPATQFLQHSTNILHIGGNIGQERYIYEYFKLNVAFIEPIPEVFGQLSRNIQGFPKIKAFNELFWRTSGQKLDLNIANNNGSSSSIFDLADHKIIWPDVNFVKKITLNTVSGDDFVNSRKWGLIPDTIVMDTQGSELEILKGCDALLKYVKFIKIELPNFNAYENECTLNEVVSYLQNHNYRVLEQVLTKETKGFSGRYYEVVFEKTYT